LQLGGKRNSSVLRRRLAGLSESDCSRQLKIVERSVRARFAIGGGAVRPKTKHLAASPSSRRSRRGPDGV